MKRRELLCGLAGGLGLGITGCDWLFSPEAPPSSNGDKPTPVRTQKVAIENFAFFPLIIQIQAGQTVSWTQLDLAIHTVTSTHPAGLFDSGDLELNEQFSFTFEAPGVYEYFCIPHPFMTGTVIVEEAEAPS